MEESNLSMIVGDDGDMKFEIHSILHAEQWRKYTSTGLSTGNDGKVDEGIGRQYEGFPSFTECLKWRPM